MLNVSAFAKNADVGVAPALPCDSSQASSGRWSTQGASESTPRQLSNAPEPWPDAARVAARTAKAPAAPSRNVTRRLPGGALS